jgi:hypothetical protein
MVVILGAGYTGRFIYAQATARGLSALVTSRMPDTHLSFASPPHRVPFDLDRDYVGQPSGGRRSHLVLSRHAIGVRISIR